MSEDGGTASLERQLAALGTALQAFDDPLGLELPGMRLMRDALVEREAHVRATLDKARTAGLEVTVAGQPVVDGRIEADFLAELLAALGEAVQAVGAGLEELGSVDEHVRREALRLHLAAVEGQDGGVTLRLQEPPVDPAARLTAGTASAAEAALDGVLAVLEDGAVGDGAPAEALRRLARLVVGRAVRVELELLAVARVPRAVSLERSLAQRLAVPGGA